MSATPDIGLESRLAGSVGRLVESAGYKNHRARLDATGRTLSTSTWTLTAPSTATTYAVDIVVENGDFSQTWSISVLTDGTNVDDNLRDPFVDAIELESDLMAYIQDITVAAGSIVIRAKAGYELTATEVTDSTNDISISNAAAADAPSYLYGRFLKVADAPTTQPDRHANEGVTVLSALAGPVLSLVVTNDAGGTYSGDIIYNGKNYPFSASGNATPATTYGNIKTAIETALGAALLASDGIVVTAAATTTVAGPVGSLLSAADVAATGGSAAMTASVTAGDAVPECALCIDDMQTPMLDGDSSNITGPLPGSSVLCADASGNANVYAVTSPGAITRNGDVWVETTSGATKGRAYTAGSTTRFKHPTAKWKRRDPQNSSIAHLSL